ncbi:HOOK protein-domain-containing protein [Gilbertella persicaria]|uniref:HOOK protein-domain-containing protein n=1 Tax=Gilbertella persicaria TaxID=101096 RepID=UPI00221FE47A|nr:HOOK protein-domain-containing protein [Gilbertella persicaria]KAI8062795.1 HOOK protein-domain-containing protein [Gilbertella persicaria]
MMRIAESEGGPAAAVVQWSISHSVSHIQDLSDGITLFEVASNIDYKWFKLIRSADVGDNWVLKINNLKKLYKLISRYYEEKLGVSFSKLPEINLNAIAKDSDPHEIIQLCKYVLYIAVCCPDNSQYIQNITQLSNASQENLMFFIDEIMRYTKDDQPMEPQQASEHDTQMHSFADEGTYKSELTRIVKEKEELEIQNRQLIDKHSELLTRYDRLENEKQDLQARLKDMDTAVAQANETGRADFIMRTEIEHLKQDLQRSEDTRQEQERRLDDQTFQINDLTKRNEELTKYAEQAALEDQNHTLMDRNQKIEDEYRNVLAFKTLMDSYKDQVTMLETKNNELVREKNKLDYELVQMTKKMELLEADRERDSDRIQTLEENLQEAQLGMGSLVERPTANRTSEADTDDIMEIDDEFNLNDSLEDSLKESNVTELKLSKRRLERQVKTLQEENAQGRNQKAVVLQHLLDDANRLKNQFEKSYIEVSQERDILQSDMARIREGIPDALVNQNQHTLSLRLRIVELEKEIKSLNETVKKLEQKIAEGRFSDGEEGGDFHAKYVELESRSKQLEEQTKKQLQDINKLLLEKDLLQGQSIEQKDLLLEKERLNSEMKASLAAFEAKGDEPFKQQNAHLQQQLIQLQEELHEVKTKLKKAKEFIKQQDKLFKDSKEQALDGNKNEAISSMKTEIAMREEEIEKLKKFLQETRIQARREQQLMISAWYDMSRRTNKEVVNKTFPNSWLGQQRRTLDNQLKRR